MNKLRRDMPGVVSRRHPHNIRCLNIQMYKNVSDNLPDIRGGCASAYRACHSRRKGRVQNVKVNGYKTWDLSHLLLHHIHHIRPVHFVQAESRYHFHAKVFTVIHFCFTVISPTRAQLDGVGAIHQTFLNHPADSCLIVVFRTKITHASASAKMDQRQPAVPSADRTHLCQRADLSPAYGDTCNTLIRNLSRKLFYDAQDVYKRQEPGDD